MRIASSALPVPLWLAIPILLIPACASMRRGGKPDGDADLLAAERALAERDFERAQSGFDRVTGRLPQSAEAWLGFGDASMGLFEACVADPRRGNALLHLQDAKRGFEKAIELDPNGLRARIGAVRAARQLGDARAELQHADALERTLAGNTDPEGRFDAFMELGRSRAGEFRVAARESEGGGGATLDGLYSRVLEAFQAAAAADPTRPEPAIDTAWFEFHRGAPADAQEILFAEIEKRPEEARFHQALADMAARSAGYGALAEAYADRIGKLTETSATASWFAGCASLLAGEALRVSDAEASTAALNEAIVRLKRSYALKPEFTQTAKFYESSAMAGLARIQFDAQQTAEAARLLTKALEVSVAALERADQHGVSPKRTSLEIGGVYFKADELAKGAELFEEWLRLSPQDSDWLNNAGLLRRDLGEKLRREGKTEEARRSHELSYSHYSKLAELKPNEPRVVNDTALLLLYDLDRDLDKAEAMFRRAIELGEAELKQRGERPTPDEEDPESLRAAADWDYFAEATGDACQNLGLLLWKQGGDSVQIRKHLERAFELDPRGTRARMRGILKELPDSGPAPRRTNPLR
ncbi:MAG: hypothetical protein JNJ88_17190 [Planctomycetes bacterium]|nr:hypothetical protein [Planctomycetota bacterium]